MVLVRGCIKGCKTDKRMEAVVGLLRTLEVSFDMQV